jgi:hypothetical protein
MCHLVVWGETNEGLTMITHTLIPTDGVHIVETAYPRAMTQKQYLDALKKLGLTPAGKATAEALGLSVRQCIRIGRGQSRVPGPVAKLLALMLEYR